MIGSYSPWFNERLKELIEKERVQKAVDLGNAYAQDFADYRYGCGLIEGLRLAGELVDHLQQEVEKS
jgi:hypothetical protein